MYLHTVAQLYVTISVHIYCLCICMCLCTCVFVSTYMHVFFVCGHTCTHQSKYVIHKTVESFAYHFVTLGKIIACHHHVLNTCLSKIYAL